MHEGTVRLMCSANMFLQGLKPISVFTWTWEVTSSALYGVLPGAYPTPSH